VSIKLGELRLEPLDGSECLDRRGERTSKWSLIPLAGRALRHSPTIATLKIKDAIYRSAIIPTCRIRGTILHLG
jgi:hypothetical protein